MQFFKLVMNSSRIAFLLLPSWDEKRVILFVILSFLSYFLSSVQFSISEMLEEFLVAHGVSIDGVLELDATGVSLSMLSKFSDLFDRKNISYSLRSQPDFVIPQVKTVYKGSNSLRYFGPIIWSLIPKKIKSCDTLASFISNIRQWRPDACPCRICKNFIPNVGFIETY